MKRFLPFLTLLVLAGCGSDETPAALGSVASDFTVETLTMPSSTASLHKRRGKVLLLDFWATWCGPCRQIAPSIEAIYGRYKGQGLEAMAISPEDRDVVAAYEQKSPRSVPVYLDTNRSATLSMGASSLPTIQVIGRDGRIVYETHGIRESTPDEISDAVKTALEAK